MDDEGIRALVEGELSVRAEGERMATLSLAGDIWGRLKRAGVDTEVIRAVVEEAVEAVWKERQLDTPERGWNP